MENNWLSIKKYEIKRNSSVVLKMTDISLKSFGLYQIKGPNGAGKTRSSKI